MTEPITDQGGTPEWPLRALIVEDEPAIRLLLEKTFVQHGWSAHAFADAESALEALGRLDLDIAIIDLHLPGRSGLEMVREMRLQGIHLPTLVLTADQSPVARMAAESGLHIDAFLLKPVDRPVLVRRAEQIVKRRKAGIGAARFLSDYVGELGEIGTEQFQARYGGAPVLVGLGLVTSFARIDRVPTPPRGSRRTPPTFPVDQVPAGQAPHAAPGRPLTDRAWPVQPREISPLEPARVITLGRGTHCDLVIPEFSISETHAELRYDDGWFFVDRESLNGSIIDGTSPKPGVPCPLRDGSRIVMGRFQFELYMGPRFVELVRQRASGHAPPPGS